MEKINYQVSDSFRVEEYIAPFTNEFADHIIHLAAENLHRKGFENYVPDDSNYATLAYLFKNKEFASFYITYENDAPQLLTGTRIVFYHDELFPTFFSRLFSVLGRTPNQVHHFEKLCELQAKFLKGLGYTTAYYSMNVSGRDFFRKYLDHHKDKKYSEWKGYPISYIHKIQYEGEQDFMFCQQHVYSINLNEV